MEQIQITVEKLGELLTKFQEIVFSTTKDIHLLKEQCKDLSKRIKALERFGRYFVSLQELESAMDKFKVGVYMISIKDLDVFTLYIGDEYALLLYPDFVDIGKPFIKSQGLLRTSKWLLKEKIWDEL